MKKLSVLGIGLCVGLSTTARLPAAAWEERMAWDRLICP